MTDRYHLYFDDTGNETILFGFGKDQSGYFGFDWDGRPLMEACSSIDEILAVFK